MSAENLTYYHAGALFNLKELTGNTLLAQAIRHESKGRYHAVLPQDFSLGGKSNHAIRDADLLALLSADVALFHFDGTEIDSGTVVEFMVAKFADIPAVLLRTDFRRAGESDEHAWNLMLGDYPRTAHVVIHALELYHRQRHPERALEDAVERATQETARRVVAAFDEVIRMPAMLAPELREPVYRWLAHFPAYEMPRAQAEQTLRELLAAKTNRGLL